MRFLKRGQPKADDQTTPIGWVGPGQAQTSQPVEPSVADILGEDPLAGIDLAPTSVAEAKLSIKDLRLRKNDLATRKRVIAGELAELRDYWRERQAGRYSTVGLGRGTGGRIARSMIQSGRRDERMAYAESVNLLNESKQALDDLMGDVDRAILTLERYILRAGST